MVKGEQLQEVVIGAVRASKDAPYAVANIGRRELQDFSVTENIKSVYIVFQPETNVDAATRKRTKKMLQGIRLSDSSSLASSEAIAAAGADSQNP